MYSAARKTENKWQPAESTSAVTLAPQVGENIAGEFLVAGLRAAASRPRNRSRSWEITCQRRFVADARSRPFRDNGAPRESACLAPAQGRPLRTGPRPRD